jgi:hypothetical protein
MLDEVIAFRRRHDMDCSRFGEEAAGDPHFVWDLRRKRRVGTDTVARVRAFMAAADKARGF